MCNLNLCITRRIKIKQKALSKSLDAIVKPLFYTSVCNKSNSVMNFNFCCLNGKKNKREAEGFFLCFSFSVQEHKSIKTIIRPQKL